MKTCLLLNRTKSRYCLKLWTSSFFNELSYYVDCLWIGIRKAPATACDARRRPIGIDRTGAGFQLASGTGFVPVLPQ
jgi:hypothetical protein